MAHYERTADDKFIYTQINQKEIDLLRLAAYASYWILPEKLQASAYGGMQRCFNYGNDYSHFYTSWFCMGSVTAYLGRFTIQAYADNGNRFLEGENRGYQGASVVLKGSYRYKDWNFSLAYNNPFCKNYKFNEGEILNKDLRKLTTVYDRSSVNCLIFGVSWRMSHGKTYKSANKTINLRDTDNGIMK